MSLLFGGEKRYKHIPGIGDNNDELECRDILGVRLLDGQRIAARLCSRIH
jgi:hypothetical protein